MSWSVYVADTTTGQLVCPVDIPSFAWTVSVSDATLATTKDKGTGKEDASGLTVPWSAIPGDSLLEKARLLTADKRAIALLWRTRDDEQAGTPGTPILFGSISPRTDSWNDTRFTVCSLMDLLDSRYCVREGKFGTAPNHTTSDEIRYTGMSLRAIAAEVGRMCTDYKPAGSLPIDWQYLGEKGKHERTYQASNVQNLSCRAIMEKIANVQGGPDIQLRPYLSDGQHVRLRFEAGSDTGVYLNQRTVHRLTATPYGATLENMTVDRIGPVHRVYASGTGTDNAQTQHLAQNLTLAQQTDPWPLREMTYADNDTDKIDLLRAHAQAVLDTNRTPLMQIKGELNADTTDQGGTPLHPLGSFWPGETFELAVTGYPSLPDGLYTTRLMSMTGNETGTVTLTFDPMPDPLT